MKKLKLIEPTMREQITIDDILDSDLVLIWHKGTCYVLRDYANPVRFTFASMRGDTLLESQRNIRDVIEVAQANGFKVEVYRDC